MNYFELILAVLGFLISPFMVLIYSVALAFVMAVFARRLWEDLYDKTGIAMGILSGLLVFHVLILITWYASVGMYPHVWHSLR